MRYLSIIFFCVGMLLQVVPSYSNCDESYPKLDKALISLWHSSKISDHEGAKKALDQIDREWSIVVPDLYKYLNPFVNVEEFDKDMDYFIISMKISLYEEDYPDLAIYAMKMLHQFKMLRAHQNNSITEVYSLDHLLNMIELYSEIDDTVHDQMFGLKYWFEFADLVSGFESEWAVYDDLSIEQITICFPFITQGEHDLLKDKVTECLTYFTDSLDSGYRTDFEMPCEELGGALKELLVLYSDKDNVGLSHKN